MERFRPALRNRRGEPTSAAEKVHGLVRADALVQAHHDPDVSFAMSPMQKARHEVIVESLSTELGIPQRPDKRERRIRQMREALEDEGIPYTRVFPTKEIGGR